MARNPLSNWQVESNPSRSWCNLRPLRATRHRDWDGCDSIGVPDMQRPKNAKYAHRAAEYLRPEWQKKRVTILQRDDFTCQICWSKDNTLHVHHYWYPPANVPIWNVPNSSLVSLCSDCHEPEHETMNEALDDLKTMIRQGGITSDILRELLEHFPNMIGDDTTMRMVFVDIEAILSFGGPEYLHKAAMEAFGFAHKISE